MKAIATLATIAAALAIPCIAEATLILPIQNLTTVGPNLHAGLKVSGLPELPVATFQSTQVSPAKALQFTGGQVSVDPTFGTYALKLIPAAKETQYGIEPFGVTTTHPRLLVADAHAGVDSTPSPLQPLAVYVGADLNGDGLPEQDELLCKADFSQDWQSARCVADISAFAQGQIANYWMLVQVPAGTSEYIATSYYATLQTISRLTGYAEVETGQSSGDQIVLTGPGHASTGVPIPLRLSSGFYAFFPPDPGGVSQATFPLDIGQTYYGAILVDTDPVGGIGSAGIIPFSLKRLAGGDDSITRIGVPLAAGASSGATLPVRAGPALNESYFDLPPTVDGSPLGPLIIDFIASSDDVQFSLIRADFPQQSSAPLVDPAPATTPLLITKRGEVELRSLASGRWYVVATNAGAADRVVSVSLTSGYLFPDYVGGYVVKPGYARLGAIGTPTIASGFYYNHQRSGHGIALSQASGQQVVNWYTYLEDGTPQWYEAQAAAPDASSGWWQAPLYRVAWDGSKARLTQVGDITLTPIATNEFMFTWTLEGQSGSERFVGLARNGACPQFNGVTTNFTGAWYAPTLSGYGMDVLSLPEQQFNTFYFYDDLGLARWGVGSSLPFATNSTMTFNQNTGFCPNCAVAPITAQTLGTIDIDYASSSNGNLSTNLVLKAPLSGTWSYSRPMSRLTGSSACVE